MSIHLRDYQKEAKGCIHEEFKEVNATLVVLPTGTGKTVLFAEVCQDFQPLRAMVIAHREELIWQACDKIRQFTGLQCGVEMADQFVNGNLFGDLPVVVSTVQTQNSVLGDRKRMGRFDPKDFGVLIIDEAHHATADSYRHLINYYQQNNPKIKILGVTATPDRKDEQALGQIFNTVAFDYEILDAINDGWLVPIDQQFVAIDGLDFSEIDTTAGDLNGADLARVMETEKNLQGVAASSLEIIGARRTIVFTASVKQAETISNIFNRHRADMSAWVCGTTNKDDRRKLLSQFKTGQIQVICNCGVLTEGFDDPGVEVIVMARPTKSRSLYAQMAGRSTRPLPGLVDGLPDAEARRTAIELSKKPSCLIVDFVGNSGRHKLMTAADILGGKVSDEAIAAAVAKAKTAMVPVRMSEAMIAEEQRLIAEAEARRLLEEARKQKLVAKARYSVKTINPFDVFNIAPAKERGWDQGKTLSEKQTAILLKQGINPDGMPYAQAKQILGELFRRWNGKLATLKQVALLKKYGYTDPNITMEQASKIIDQLAANRWRRV
jgi:superfamily II DNA or RNA helicase